MSYPSGTSAVTSPYYFLHHQNSHHIAVELLKFNKSTRKLVSVVILTMNRHIFHRLGEVFLSDLYWNLFISFIFFCADANRLIWDNNVHIRLRLKYLTKIKFYILCNWNSWRSSCLVHVLCVVSELRQLVFPLNRGARRILFKLRYGVL